MSDDSDDDAPPVATSLNSSRAAALAREKAAPTRVRCAQKDRMASLCACAKLFVFCALVCSLREGAKAAEKKKRSVVTAGLRGDDYLPPELLDQLPSTTTAPAQPDEPQKKRPTRAEAKAAAKRARPHEPEPRDGLPITVQKAYALRTLSCRPPPRALSLSLSLSLSLG